MNNDEIIYNIALKNGFNPTQALFIIGQSRHESADYTSNVYIQNNNGFGMKYVAQPLATRGTLAPTRERIRPITANINYYSKYRSFEDSVKDAIERLFNITINGVTPAMLRSARTSLEYAEMQKKRGYFGGTALRYSKGIDAGIKKVDLKNITKSSLNVLPLIIIFFTYYIYKLLTNKS